MHRRDSAGISCGARDPIMRFFGKQCIARAIQCGRRRGISCGGVPVADGLRVDSAAAPPDAGAEPDAAGPPDVVALPEAAEYSALAALREADCAVPSVPAQFCPVPLWPDQPALQAQDLLRATATRSSVLPRELSHCDLPPVVPLQLHSRDGHGLHWQTGCGRLARPAHCEPALPAERYGARALPLSPQRVHEPGGRLVRRCSLRG